MYKNVILDFNGTLIDDCDVCLKILNILLEKYNLPKVSKEYYMDIFTFPVSNYYAKVGFDTSSKSFAEISKLFHKYYDDLSYKEVKLFDDVIDFLNILKQNKITLICLSASMKQTLDKQLKFYNIYDYFDYVVGLDNKLAMSKEKVAIEFINKNNIDVKSTLFIGDSIHDYEVAKALNCNCYLVATGHSAKYRLVKELDNVADCLMEIKDYILK